MRPDPKGSGSGVLDTSASSRRQTRHVASDHSTRGRTVEAWLGQAGDLAVVVVYVLDRHLIYLLERINTSIAVLGTAPSHDQLRVSK